MLLIVLICCLLATPAHAVTVSEFPPLPNDSSLPGGLATGADGAVWFTELNSYAFSGRVARIGRLTPSGSLTEYSLPGSGDAPTAIARGEDGNLWFTNSGSDTIGRIDAQGAIHEFGGLVAGAAPRDITGGPDGALWFTEGGYNAANRIGRIDTAGNVTEYCIRGCAGPSAPGGDGLEPGGIVSGPDGRLWFTEANPAASEADPYGDAGRGYVAAATPDGKVQEYPVPTPDAQPTDIAVGADGALWFTERAAGKIGRITTAGAIEEFVIPRPSDASWITQSSWPTAIARGPDGAVWFVENHANRIGRIDTVGRLAHWPIPLADSNPGGIALGPDGRLYFSETSGNRIGVVATDGAAAAVLPGPGGGPAPAPSAGSGTRPAATIAAVTARARWVRARRRWRLLVQGTLTLRGSDTGACRRALELRLRRGRRVLAVRRVRAGGRCSYRATIPVARPARGLLLGVRVPGTRPLRQVLIRVPAPPSRPR